MARYAKVFLQFDERWVRGAPYQRALSLATTGALHSVPPTESPSRVPRKGASAQAYGATPRRSPGCCAARAELGCTIPTHPALGPGRVAAVGGELQVPQLVSVRYLPVAALRGGEWPCLFEQDGQ